MKLFGKYENIITDLYDFSRIYSKAISGTNFKPISDIMIEKWGSVSNNYKHSFGSHLKYKNKIFWAGLAFNRKSKAVCFILQFKPGAKSLSQKRSLNIAMENDTFTNFCKTRDVKIIQQFILTSLK